MSDRSAKQLVEHVLSRLPDDATMEDVQYSLYVADLICRRSTGIDDALKDGVDEALRTRKRTAHADVVKRMARWLRK